MNHTLFPKDHIASVAEDVRVSYIITTKNRAQFLQHALANVREFIEPMDELIVIDGASTDDTREVVARYNDIITVFISELDCGEAHAFNKALFRARGRYIKSLTDDDYFYPDAMRQLVTVMEGNPACEAIQCGGEVWWASNGSVSFRGTHFLADNDPDTARAISARANCGLGLIIRRSAFEKIGGVSSNYTSVDGDIYCRLIECCCKMCYLDIKLYRWYCHPHSAYLKTERMDRDRLMFSLRMHDWDHFVRQNPKVMCSLVGGETTAKSEALFTWIWLAGLLARSPLWRISLIVYGPVRSILRGLRHWRQSVPGQSHDWGRQRCDHEWTGELL